MNSIRMFRERAGLTQLQLAEKVNISLDSVRRYENGEREPRWSDISAMCEVFADQNCSPTQLMSPPDMVNPMPPLSQAEQGETATA